jgi:trans-aconitate methyltransferase
MALALYEKSKSKEFYEKRFAKGKITGWSDEKKLRVIKLLRQLELPEFGVALDFGCGNGFFTDVLAEALPGWQIHGCDLSEVGVKNASDRYPHCLFFVLDIEKFPENEYDLLFTHHVLEHVYNIREVVKDISSFTKPVSHVIHILPCGNEDSLEHRLSMIRKNGINQEMEDRFFFEDEGHVRRLNTFKLNGLMGEFGFRIAHSYYANQHHGAIRWMSRTSIPMIWKLTDVSSAVDGKSRITLMRLKLILLFLYIIQLPTSIMERLNLIYNKSFYHRVLQAILFLPSFLSRPFYAWIDANAQSEWESESNKENGSEMYMHYERKVG